MVGPAAAAVLTAGLIGYGLYGLWQTGYQTFTGTNYQTGQPLTTSERWESGTEFVGGLGLLGWGLSKGVGTAEEGVNGSRGARAGRDAWGVCDWRARIGPRRVLGR